MTTSALPLPCDGCDNITYYIYIISIGQFYSVVQVLYKRCIKH